MDKKINFKELSEYLRGETAIKINLNTEIVVCGTYPVLGWVFRAVPLFRKNISGHCPKQKIFQVSIPQELKIGTMINFIDEHLHYSNTENSISK